jgi:hypothetical protein
VSTAPSTRTATARYWSETAVKTARRNHAIDGCAQSIVDPEVLTLKGAARYTGMSRRVLKLSGGSSAIIGPNSVPEVDG